MLEMTAVPARAQRLQAMIFKEQVYAATACIAVYRLYHNSILCSSAYACTLAVNGMRVLALVKT
jgi:hypothetical protein